MPFLPIWDLTAATHLPVPTTWLKQYMSGEPQKGFGLDLNAFLNAIPGEHPDTIPFQKNIQNRTDFLKNFFNYGFITMNSWDIPQKFLNSFYDESSKK